MNNERISKRYAKSIYVLSEQQNNTEIILKDMKIVLSLIKESKDFKNFLFSPILKPKKKIEIIENKVNFSFLNKDGGYLIKYK